MRHLLLVESRSNHTFSCIFSSYELIFDTYCCLTAKMEATDVERGK